MFYIWSYFFGKNSWLILLDFCLIYDWLIDWFMVDFCLICFYWFYWVLGRLYLFHVLSPVRAKCVFLISVGIYELSFTKKTSLKLSSLLYYWLLLSILLPKNFMFEFIDPYVMSYYVIYRLIYKILTTNILHLTIQYRFFLMSFINLFRTPIEQLLP